MASKPRKASKARLKVVGHIGTPESVIDLLTEASLRAQDDETLAIALVEIKRGGVIETHTIGDDYGFRHALFAGCGYLMRDLGADDE